MIYIQASCYAKTKLCTNTIHANLYRSGKNGIYEDSKLTPPFFFWGGGVCVFRDMLTYSRTAYDYINGDYMKWKCTICNLRSPLVVETRAVTMRAEGQGMLELTLN